MSEPEKPFWESVPLAEMTGQQWESLCDGCAQCCRVKLEDEGEVRTTAASCRLLDTESCRCTNYPRRQQEVPECLTLDPAVALATTWLPDTCAYRLIAEGKPLFQWHPLISGNPDSVHTEGISVRGQVISEEYIHPDDLLRMVRDD